MIGDFITGGTRERGIFDNEHAMGDIVEKVADELRGVLVAVQFVNPLEIRVSM